MPTAIYNPFIKIRLVLLFIVITGFISCDDVFEEDLTDDIVILLSPSDQDTSLILSQNFKWEEVDEAVKYRIQIVSISFSSSNSYILDSTVTSENIYFSLAPGTYQWRVKAINYSSESEFSSPFTLVIDTTSDLTNQLVVLNSPINNADINDTIPVFQWQSIGIADSYNIIVKSGTNWNTGSVLINDTVTINNYTSPIVFSEGQYVWGVRAINSNSYTASYNQRPLNIDLTNPPKPIPSSPVNTSNQAAATISFAWSRPADAGIYQSSRFDSLFVFSDTAMSISVGKFVTTNTGYSLSITQNDTYFWYLIGYDNAGNKSDTSSVFSFTIQ